MLLIFFILSNNILKSPEDKKKFKKKSLKREGRSNVCIKLAKQLKQPSMKGDESFQSL
jgi:hypothetical protein